MTASGPSPGPPKHYVRIRGRAKMLCSEVLDMFYCRGERYPISGPCFVHPCSPGLRYAGGAAGVRHADAQGPGPAQHRAGLSDGSCGAAAGRQQARGRRARGGFAAAADFQRAGDAPAGASGDGGGTGARRRGGGGCRRDGPAAWRGGGDAGAGLGRTGSGHARRGGTRCRPAGVVAARRSTAFETWLPPHLCQRPWSRSTCGPTIENHGVRAACSAVQFVTV